MARIPLVSLSDSSIPQEKRDLFARMAQQRGFEPNVLRALANYPDFVALVADWHLAINAGGLTEDQLQLAYLTASMANECHY